MAMIRRENETQRSRVNKEDSGVTDFAGAKLLKGSAALVMPGLGILATSDVSLAQAPAAQSERPTAPLVLKLDAAITVRSDRTWQTVVTQRASVFTESAIDRAGRQSISYIESMESLEVTAAYTEKPNGRRIPVEPANIVKRDGASPNETVYRDIKQITIFYPDLAVGDTVVYTVKVEHKGSAYPGHVFESVTFPGGVQLADSTIRIAVARSVPLRVNSFGNGIQGRRSEEGDTIRYSGTIAGQAPGPERTVNISTFEDLAAVGHSYWGDAKARATVTPEVRKLADEITRGIPDRRAQAEAISLWVKRNIRYVAVYFGTARVVPNDTATILKNRYGDCKDHVTLMTALLAAKGIASEQVLVNSGTTYDFAEVLAPRILNHVMIYLPEFKLYDDPTTPRVTFGVLTIDTHDKPVIHVSAEGVRTARTPAMQADDYVVLNRTRIRVAPDGTMTGETEQVTKGAASMTARSVAGHIQDDGVEVAAQKVLRASGNPGRGSFEMPSLYDFREPYTIRGRFALEGRLNLQAANQPIPQGMAFMRRPGEFLFAEEKERGAPFRCLAGRQIEQIELTFAEGLPMPLQLNPRKLETRLFSYATSYKIENRTYIIRREFVSNVPGQFCKPDIAAEIAEPLKQVASNINDTKLLFAKPQPEASTGKPGTTGQRAEAETVGTTRSLRETVRSIAN